jgi:hypothetical protein
MAAPKITGFRLGIYVFKDAEIVDFAAPHGVFSVARRFNPELDAFLIADAMRPVQTQAGFTVLPNYSFVDRPAMDAFLIPRDGVQQGVRAVPRGSRRDAPVESRSNARGRNSGFFVDRERGGQSPPRRASPFNTALILDAFKTPLPTDPPHSCDPVAAFRTRSVSSCVPRSPDLLTAVHVPAGQFRVARRSHRGRCVLADDQIGRLLAIADKSRFACVQDLNYRGGCACDHDFGRNAVERCPLGRAQRTANGEPGRTWLNEKATATIKATVAGRMSEGRTIETAARVKAKDGNTA